jgi:hypothetical protein
MVVAQRGLKRGLKLSSRTAQPDQALRRLGRDHGQSMSLRKVLYQLEVVRVLRPAPGCQVRARIGTLPGSASFVVARFQIDADFEALVWRDVADTLARRAWCSLVAGGEFLV